MLDEMGLDAPTTVGRAEFAECLRHLRDRHKGIALGHIRRALRAEPQNPFFLSYAGMLCAVSEKRYVAGERLCRVALKIKCNHAQLYLNLAEVYHQAGRDGDTIETLKKDSFQQAATRAFVRRLKRLAGVALLYCPALDAATC